MGLLARACVELALVVGLETDARVQHLCAENRCVQRLKTFFSINNTTKQSKVIISIEVNLEFDPDNEH